MRSLMTECIELAFGGVAQAHKPASSERSSSNPLLKEKALCEKSTLDAKDLAKALVVDAIEPQNIASEANLGFRSMKEDRQGNLRVC